MRICHRRNKGHTGRNPYILGARIVFGPCVNVSITILACIEKGARTVAVTSFAQTSQMYFTPPSVPRTAVFFFMTPMRSVEDKSCEYVEMNVMPDVPQRRGRRRRTALARVAFRRTRCRLSRASIKLEDMSMLLEVVW